MLLFYLSLIFKKKLNITIYSFVKSDFTKKASEFQSELGKEAAKFGENISKAGDNISQTAAYKKVSEVTTHQNERIY